MKERHIGFLPEQRVFCQIDDKAMTVMECGITNMVLRNNARKRVGLVGRGSREFQGKPSRSVESVLILKRNRNITSIRGKWMQGSPDEKE